MQHFRAQDGDVDFSSRYPITLFANWKPEEDEKVPNFHTFPKSRGLCINDENGEVQFGETDQAEDVYAYTHHPSRFMQRWLYFELLREVFWETFQKAGRDFKMSHFTTESSGRRWVTTANLRHYLELWKDFEIQQKKIAAPGQTRRLVRIQQVLNRARHFVHSFLSVSDAGKNPIWRGVDSYVTLSIMVLGETLSRANRQVREAIRFDINGWQYYPASDSHGWGYCKVILEALNRERWCPHKTLMLQALFRGNIIGLLHAIESQGFAGYHQDHRECTKEKCVARREKYTLAHAPGMWNCSCSTCGPDPEEIAKVLEQGYVPLLRIENFPDGPKIKVETMKAWEKDYAIFSHVWMDGFGNPDNNKIHDCVLEFFTHLFHQISEELAGTARSQGIVSPPELFWIDTLAVPIKDQYPRESKMAISKMHDIYANAKYTIVLDKGLISQPIAPGYASTAMKITMSGWMTRLWTLQEALLSRNVYFSLYNGVCSLEQLESRYERDDMQIYTCIPSVARAYYHGIIGSERHRRRDPDMRADRQIVTSEFVARVWKAFQWRTTTHAQHESLALATLLRLETDPFDDTDESPLSFKGLDSFSGDRERVQRRQARVLDRRMRKIILLLSNISPCPIPGAMIFLPGPRLTGEGFGWAPQTWLSSQLELHPDPFTTPSGETSLDLPYGLRVQYPGFLLHSMDGWNDPRQRSSEFRFTTDSDLHAWFRVVPIDNLEPLPLAEELGRRQLAVIALRLPLILEFETALLVSIRTQRNDRFDVEIESRVYLSREYKENKLDSWRSSFRTYNFDSIFCGEVLPKTQIWCVDGPRKRNDPERTRRERRRETFPRLSSGAKDLVDLMYVHGFDSGESDIEISQAPTPLARQDTASWWQQIRSRTFSSSS